MTSIKYTAIYEYKKMKLLYEEYVEKKTQYLLEQTFDIRKQYINAKLNEEDRKKLCSWKLGSWHAILGENNIQFVVLLDKDLDETIAYNFISKVRSRFNKNFPKTYKKASKSEKKEFSQILTKVVKKYNDMLVSNTNGLTSIAMTSSCSSDNHISDIRREFYRSSIAQISKNDSEQEKVKKLYVGHSDIYINNKLSEDYMDYEKKKSSENLISEEVAGDSPTEQLLDKKEVKDGVQILVDEKDIEVIDKKGPLCLSIMTISVIILFIGAFACNFALVMYIHPPDKD